MRRDVALGVSLGILGALAVQKASGVGSGDAERAGAAAAVSGGQELYGALLPALPSRDCSRTLDGEVAALPVIEGPSALTLQVLADASQGSNLAADEGLLLARGAALQAVGAQARLNLTGASEGFQGSLQRDAERFDTNSERLPSMYQPRGRLGGEALLPPPTTESMLDGRNLERAEKVREKMEAREKASTSEREARVEAAIEETAIEHAPRGDRASEANGATELPGSVVDTSRSNERSPTIAEVRVPDPMHREVPKSPRAGEGLTPNSFAATAREIQQRLTPYGPEPAPLDALIFPGATEQQRNVATALVRGRGLNYDGTEECARATPLMLSEVFFPCEGERTRYGNYQSFGTVSSGMSFQAGAAGEMETRYQRTSLAPMTPYAGALVPLDPFFHGGTFASSAASSLSAWAKPSFGISLFGVGVRGASVTECWGEISPAGQFSETCLGGKTFDLFAGLKMDAQAPKSEFTAQGPTLELTHYLYGAPTVVGDRIRLDGLSGSLRVGPSGSLSWSELGNGRGLTWFGGKVGPAWVEGDRSQPTAEALKDLRWSQRPNTTP